jgi:surface antigen
LIYNILKGVVMKNIKFVFVAMIMFVISSCDNSATSNNSELGVITGGVIGAVVGSQFGGGDGKILAATAGAVAGGYIGSQIGENMDKVNRMKVNDALENTKTNQSRSWVDPDTKAQYTIKPTKTINQTTEFGEKVCRKYMMSIVIDGKLDTATGTACRDKNGDWQVAE